MTTAAKTERVRAEWPTLSRAEASAIRVIARDLEKSTDLLILTCDETTTREDMQCYLDHQIHVLRRMRDAVVEHKDRYLLKMMEETE